MSASPALTSSCDCRGTPVVIDNRHIAHLTDMFGSVNCNLTCRFQNVCYDLASDTSTLLYFSLDNTSLGVPKSVDIRPFSDLGAHQPFVNIHISRVAGVIPGHAEFFPHPRVVLFQPYAAENFGHHLADTMYSLYFMQELFHIRDPFSSQLMMLGPCFWFQGDSTDRTHCTKFMSKLYPAISRHPVLQLQLQLQLPSFLKAMRPSTTASMNQSATRLICFRELLAGAGANSYRVWGIESVTHAHSFWNFRLFMVYNMLKPQAAPILNHVHILNKTAYSHFGTGSGIRNTAELQKHLMQRFPEYLVESVDLAKMSFKDQIASMVTTAVLFSSGGGMMFSGLFLSPGAVFALIPAVPFETTFMGTLDWFSLRLLPVNLTISLTLAEEIVQEFKPTDF